MKEGSEKVCDICGARPAVMHLTQVVDNQSITTHLCDACAMEIGINNL